MLTLKRQHYELGPHLPMRLDACLSVASQIVDEIEILGKTAVLGIMQDTASCMTSSLGIFFHKASRSKRVGLTLAGVHDRDDHAKISHDLATSASLGKPRRGDQRGRKVGTGSCRSLHQADPGRDQSRFTFGITFVQPVCHRSGHVLARAVRSVCEWCLPRYADPCPDCRTIRSARSRGCSIPPETSSFGTCQTLLPG